MYKYTHVCLECWEAAKDTPKQTSECPGAPTLTMLSGEASSVDVRLSIYSQRVHVLLYDLLWPQSAFYMLIGGALVPKHLMSGCLDPLGSGPNEPRSLRCLPYSTGTSIWFIDLDPLGLVMGLLDAGLSG